MKRKKKYMHPLKHISNENQRTIIVSRCNIGYGLNNRAEIVYATTRHIRNTNPIGILEKMKNCKRRKRQVDILIDIG